MVMQALPAADEERARPAHAFPASAINDLRWFWREREAEFGIRSTFGAQTERLAAMAVPRQRRIIYGDPSVTLPDEDAPPAKSGALELDDGIPWVKNAEATDGEWIDGILESLAAKRSRAPTPKKPRKKKRRVEAIPEQTIHCGLGTMSVHWEDQFIEEIDGRMKAARRERWVRHRIAAMWRAGRFREVDILYLAYGPETIPRDGELDVLRDLRVAFGDLALVAEYTFPVLTIANEEGISARAALRRGLTRAGHADFKQRVLIIAERKKEAAEQAYATACACPITARAQDRAKHMRFCDG